MNAPSVGLPPARPTIAATARVAAVQHLLAAPRHQRTWDIVLATVFDVLESGPKTTRELAEAVRSQWPGSSVTDTTLSHALEHASERGLLTQGTSLHGPIWDLTDVVRIDAEQARIVAEELFVQARSTLGSDARRLLRECPDDSQLNLWFELLLEAIDTGLRPLLVDGRATKIGGIRLAPARIDADAVRRFLSERVHDTDSLKFLEAKAIAALDPSAPFWNDLVHFICVGFLLYRHVGRLQHRPEGLKDWANEIVLVDTPVLLTLLGSSSTNQHLLEFLARARQHCVRVVVMSITFDELERLLDRDEQYAADIESRVSQGADPKVVIASFSGTLRSWLSHGCGTSPLPTWPQFRARVQQVRQTLTAIGCEIEDAWTVDFAQASRVLEFRTTLEQTLASRGKSRSSSVLSHDANLLYRLEIERTANSATDEKPWPGAVIVTTDTHLDDTYRSVDGEDHGFPVAVSVAQLATIVAESASPGEAEEMIKSATIELMSGALLRRAARLPTEAAVALIDGIGAHGAEPVDVQLTLDEVLLHEDALAGSRAQITGAVGQALATRSAANRAVLSEHRQRSDRHEKQREIDSAVDRQQRIDAEARHSETSDLLATTRDALKESNRQRELERDRHEAELHVSGKRGQRKFRWTVAAGLFAVSVLVLGYFVFRVWIVQPWLRTLFLLASAWVVSETIYAIFDEEVKARHLARTILSSALVTVIGLVASPAFSSSPPETPTHQKPAPPRSANP